MRSCVQSLAGGLIGLINSPRLKRGGQHRPFSDSKNNQFSTFVIEGIKIGGKCFLGDATRIFLLKNFY